MLRRYIKKQAPFSRPKNTNTRTLSQRRYQIITMENQPKFGCLFDIDGVLLRGKTPIPVASEALKMIYKVNIVANHFFSLKMLKSTSYKNRLILKMETRF